MEKTNVSLPFDAARTTEEVSLWANTMIQKERVALAGNLKRLSSWTEQMPATESGPIVLQLVCAVSSVVQEKIGREKRPHLEP